MEYVLMFQHGWQILRRYKVLWLLGALAALAGQDALFNLRGAIRLQPFVEAIVNLPVSIANLLRAITPDVGLLALLIVIAVGVLLTFVGVVINAIIINLTQAAERGAAVSFKSAWQASLLRAWPLLIMRLLFNIPSVILSLLAVFAAMQIIEPTASSVGYTQLLQALQIVGLLPIFLIAGAVIGVLLGAIGIGADRSCVLDETGVIDSLRQGWKFLRREVARFIYLAGMLLGTLAMLFFVIACPISLLLTDDIANLMQAAPSTDFLIAMLSAPVGWLVGIVLVIVYGAYCAFATIVWTLAYRQYA